MEGIIEITTIAGVRVKLIHVDGYIVIDILEKSSDEIEIYGTVRPESWLEFKKSINVAEQVIIEAGWMRI